MSDFLLSLVFAAGASMFIYSKVMKFTMRPDASITLAALGGVIGFIVVYSLAKLLGV